MANGGANDSEQCFFMGFNGRIAADRGQLGRWRGKNFVFLALTKR